MENQLNERGYQVYVVPRRENPYVGNVSTITEPESVTFEDMCGFTEWFSKHSDEMNGLYIMVMYFKFGLQSHVLWVRAHGWVKVIKICNERSHQK